MTISEYMSNLALESLAVANEMASDAMLCDFYSSYADEETSIANESIDLAFDDEDDMYTSSTEPATEAGFFKTLGNKFKQVISNVKEWFIKIGKTIKEWITKFLDRIKTKITNIKERSQEKKIAGYAADKKFAEADYTKRKAEIDAKISNLEEKRKSAKNGAEETRIDTEIEKLKKQLHSLETSKIKKVDNAMISAARVYAQAIAAGINQAEKAFKIACKHEDTIKDIMFKIVHTKISPKNKNSAIVDDRIHEGSSNYSEDSARNALKKVSGTETMLKNLEKIIDGIEKIKSDVEDGNSKAKEAAENFADAAGSVTYQLQALASIKVKLPSQELIARATSMEKECDTLAKNAEALEKLFGGAPAEGEKDKRPEIARVLAAYSKAANGLVSIAQAFLAIANKAESAVVASDIDIPSLEDLFNFDGME